VNLRVGLLIAIRLWIGLVGSRRGVGDGIGFVVGVPRIVFTLLWYETNDRCSLVRNTGISLNSHEADIFGTTLSVLLLLLSVARISGVRLTLDLLHLGRLGNLGLVRLVRIAAVVRALCVTWLGRLILKMGETTKLDSSPNKT